MLSIKLSVGASFAAHCIHFKVFNFKKSHLQCFLFYLLNLTILPLTYWHCKVSKMGKIIFWASQRINWHVLCFSSVFALKQITEMIAKNCLKLHSRICLLEKPFSKIVFDLYKLSKYNFCMTLMWTLFRRSLIF